MLFNSELPKGSFPMFKWLNKNVVASSFGTSNGSRYTVFFKIISSHSMAGPIASLVIGELLECAILFGSKGGMGKHKWIGWQDWKTYVGGLEIFG